MYILIFRDEEDSEACARAEKRYQAALREQEQLKTKEHLEHNWHIYSRYNNCQSVCATNLLSSNLAILLHTQMLKFDVLFKCKSLAIKLESLKTIEQYTVQKPVSQGACTTR